MIRGYLINAQIQINYGNNSRNGGPWVISPEMVDVTTRLKTWRLKFPHVNSISNVPNNCALQFKWNAQWGHPRRPELCLYNQIFIFVYIIMKSYGSPICFVTFAAWSRYITWQLSKHRHGHFALHEMLCKRVRYYQLSRSLRIYSIAYYQCLYCLLYFYYLQSCQ